LIGSQPILGLYSFKQRTGLYAGWEIVFRLPKTAAD
jgi:hypothetical protein